MVRALKSLARKFLPICCIAYDRVKKKKKKETKNRFALNLCVVRSRANRLYVCFEINSPLRFMFVFVAFCSRAQCARLMINMDCLPCLYPSLSEILVNELVYISAIAERGISDVLLFLRIIRGTLQFNSIFMHHAIHVCSRYRFHRFAAGKNVCVIRVFALT